MMIRLLLIVMQITSILSTSLGWYLKASPSLRYTSVGGNPTITCKNITDTTSTSARNSRWYKIASDGTLQQLSTDSNARVKSDGSQLRIFSARNEDNSTYCCKGSTQPLDTCDEAAVARLIVALSPEIIPGPNQTVLIGMDAVVECIIEYAGNPPYMVFRWQKSKRRLVTDGIKYTSRIIGNRMVLTIINSTTDDEGYYQCILETRAFQRSKTSVYLSVNLTGATLTKVPLPDTVYTLQLYGEDKISVGINLTIRCIIEESGNPVRTSDVHLCLVLPTGEVIIGREFNTIATMEYNGTYSCIAFANTIPTVLSFPVIVYAAPQPSFHTDTVSTPYGSSVTLPCTISVANPSPSYTWEHIDDSPSLQINDTLNDGSLLLKNVQKSGTYQCTAQNDYGSSIQVIQLKVEKPTIKNQSLELVATYLHSSCDQPEHLINLSKILQEHIASICSCGNIIVSVTVTSCAGYTATYHVQLIGAMATEAALSLITNMASSTQGLELGFVVLFLPNYTQPHCDKQTSNISSTTLAIIGSSSALLVIILILIICLLIIIACVGRKVTKVPIKETSLDKKTGATPYYSTITPPSSNPAIPCYSSSISPGYASAGCSQKQHDKPSVQKSTSGNSLHFYEKIKNQDSRLSNEYAC